MNLNPFNANMQVYSYSVCLCFKRGEDIYFEAICIKTACLIGYI